MGISFAEATRCLLGGELLAWAAFEEHKAGSIRLDTPEQRRLFAFLLEQDRAKVSRGDEDNAINLFVAQNVYVKQFSLCIPFGITQKDAVSLFERLVFNTAFVMFELDRAFELLPFCIFCPP